MQPEGVAAQGTEEPPVPIEEVGDRDPRSGDASAEDLQEMPATDLLNLLAARGYARYDSIRRVGDVYEVRATTRDLRQVVLEVDPVAGTVTEVDPAR